MARLNLPYHSLQKCGRTLLAARGSSIDSFNLDSGILLSTWTCPPIPSPCNGHETHLKEARDTLTDSTTDSVPPPAKRRRLSSTFSNHENEDEASKNVASAQDLASKTNPKKQNYRKNVTVNNFNAPNIVALLATASGQHVVAVTGEDKSIRVFEYSMQEAVKSELNQISLRPMPKRPCAISLTSDGTTIVSADKFGDVYSLPLLLPESSTPLIATSAFQPVPPVQTPQPAANELTIHSQRNLKALANQRRQGTKPASKVEVSFDHKLLLGHVSMLTDLVVVTTDGRDYILTADRDEHIRVSRGIPQAHIIEGFCLGHTEFITRLCIPRGNERILISGGGDDDLFVWDWQAGALLSKAELKIHVVKVLAQVAAREKEPGDVQDVKIVVSGIYHTRRQRDHGFQDLLIVTCEGVPALFTFTLNPGGTLEHKQTSPLPGNVLAILIDPPSQDSVLPERLIISIDTLHKPGSTTTFRISGEDLTPCLRALTLDQEFWKESDDLSFVPSSGAGVDKDVEPPNVTTLLYSLENLRKREDDRKE